MVSREAKRRVPQRKPEPLQLAKWNAFPQKLRSNMVEDAKHLTVVNSFGTTNPFGNCPHGKVEELKEMGDEKK